MANKSKAKGTAGETKIVKYLREHGVNAERRALAGINDVGDILLPDYNIIIEAKAGKMTANYNRALKEEWLRQTQVEKENAKAKAAYLVVCRFSRSVKDFEVWSADGHSFWFLDEWIEQLN